MAEKERDKEEKRRKEKEGKRKEGEKEKEKGKSTAQSSCATVLFNLRPVTFSIVIKKQASSVRRIDESASDENTAAADDKLTVRERSHVDAAGVRTAEERAPPRRR